MATNADDLVVDDDKEVTEDDLRNLKYGEDGVETSQETDEPTEPEESVEGSEETSAEDGQTEDQTTETSTEEQSTDDNQFVKELPNIKGDTLEEYTRSLEKAYQESTKEALRLKGIAEAPPVTTTTDTSEEASKDTEVSSLNPLELYAKQKMDDEITTAFETFSKDYPQVQDQADYNRFTVEVATLSNTIMNSQKRLASPSELYNKAAIILGWEKDSTPNSKDKLDMALKDKAATSKTSSGPSTIPKKSKVTPAMVAVNRLMYPGKTDAEIVKELEPFVN